MQQIWTVLQHDGPDHLGLCSTRFGPQLDPAWPRGARIVRDLCHAARSGGATLCDAEQVSALFMQQTWTVLRHDGPNHFGLCDAEQIRRATEIGFAVLRRDFILLHPPLPLVGVSIWVERGRQSNDSLVADGQVHESAACGGKRVELPLPAGKRGRRVDSRPWGN